MLRHPRHRRQTAKNLVAMLLGVWLLAAVAPCVMAAFDNEADTDMPMCSLPAGDAAARASDCDALSMLDCQLPKSQPVSVGNPGAGAPTLIILNYLPVNPGLARAIGERHIVRNAANAPNQPPNLKHAVLRL